MIFTQQPHSLPPAHHHPHADLDYEHTKQTKTHLSYSSSMGKAIKAFECQKDLALNPGSGMQP